MFTISQCDGMPVNGINAQAMAALTIGPATVMAISCQGFSGILRNAATPPIGRSVMLFTCTPSSWATTLWPSSWSPMQANTEQNIATAQPAPLRPASTKPA